MLWTTAWAWTALLSPQAQRLFCLLGADHSFEHSARLLREVAGLCVSDNTVRKLCDEHGRKMRAWQREDSEAVQAFRQAQGEVEFQTDGTCVNTTGGWREMRLSIFAKRPRGEPVLDLEAWDEQRLPEPTARFATASIRTSTALGPQWRRTARRLGVTSTCELSVLADGAKWIWNQVHKNLPGTVLVLDVYHASEHLHDAALAGQGDGLAGPGMVPGTTPHAPGRGSLRFDRKAGQRRQGRAGIDRVSATTRGPYALPAASGRRPVDRQRDGRGGVQNRHRQATEADWVAVANSKGGADRGPVRRCLQWTVRHLLATTGRIATRFRYRTPRWAMAPIEDIC